MARPDIAYLVSHGFAARMVLHSTLLGEARALGLTVAIVAPRVDDPGLVGLASELGVELVAAPSLARRGALAGEMRPYWFEDVTRNPALWAKHLRALADPRKRLRARVHLGLNRLVRAMPLLQAPIDALDRALVRSSEARALWQTLAPRLVVSTYPVDPMEASLLLAAQACGIRTVGHLLSWDNLSTKGRFTAVPERWITWGPVMGEEVTEYYGASPRHITPVGVPHFDAHIGPHVVARRGEVVRGLGLDPSHRYLLFGMSAPYFCPHEIAIVEQLAAWVSADRFGAEVDLVIRPHPQNVTGNLADVSWLPRLEALRSTRVGLDMPTLDGGGLLWSMDPRDLPRLATLVGGAAVTLNSGSTLAIDALVQDRPVVLTPFDPVEAGRPIEPWWRSARRIAAYPHIAKLLHFGGIAVTHDVEEVATAVSAYLADPTLHAAGREAARRAELHAVDGRASARAAAALRALVDEP